MAEASLDSAVAGGTGEAVVPPGEEAVPPGRRTVLLRGLTPELTEEFLRLYFNNPRNGGGEIQKLTLDGRGGGEIVYSQVEVAENILNTQKHIVALHEVRVSAPPPENVGAEGLADAARAIVVEEVPPWCVRDVLMKFFGDRSWSSGGEIDRLGIYPGGRAVIWFTDPAVAERVVAREGLTLFDCVLVVRGLAEERRVRVLGVSAKTPEYALKLLFENTQSSGGGNIREILLQGQSAIITFENPEDARNVVAKETFTLNECSLTAELYFGQIDIENSANSDPSIHDGNNSTKYSNNDCSNTETSIEDHEVLEDPVESAVDDTDLQTNTIKASGFKSSTAQKTVKMFFTSRSKSGGGNIDYFWYDSDSGEYIITFSKRAAVERVLQRDVLTLEGHKLCIKESACRSGQLVKGLVEPDKVYISGFGDISRDRLELELEVCRGCEVEDVFYPPDPDVAMVTFKKNIDFKVLQKSLSENSVEGRTLGMERVPLSRQIQVHHNMGENSKEILATFFENTKRSGGSGDVTVDPITNGSAVVTFQDHKIAKNVLERSNLEFNEQPLKHSVYRERFGVIPPNYDSAQPVVQIPADVIITDLDPNVLQYWSSVPSASSRLQGQLRQAHAQVEGSGNNGILRVTCAIRKEDQDARTLVKEWATRVREIVKTEVASLLVKRRPCLSKIWGLVRSDIEKVRQANKSVAILERDGDCTVYVVGAASMVDSVYDQVDKLCNEVELRSEHLQNAIELKGTDREVFNKANMMEKLNKQHPKLKIQQRKEDMVLNGPAGDLISVQGKIHAFTKQIQNRKVELTKFKLRVLQAMLVQNDTSLHKAIHHLKATVQVENNMAVIYGIGEDSVKCEDILTTDIQEATHQVAEDERAAIHGAPWKKLTNYLSATCDGILFIEVTDNKSGIHLAAHKSHMARLLEDIKQHIKKNTIKRVTVDMGPLDAKYMDRHMKDQVKEIEHNFSQYSIKIETCPGSFQISGTEDGLAPAQQRMEKLKNQIIRDKQLVPSRSMMNYFLKDEMGRLFIKHQEDTNKVLIHCGELTQGVPPTQQGVKPNVLAAQPFAHGPTPEPWSDATSSCNTLPPSTPDAGQVTHSSGVKIKAVVGDMTNYPVDVVVNAANSKLKHIGGLAKDIVEKGGRTIQEECNQYVRTNGEIKDGGAVMTMAGKLQCSYIIHAVGPHYRGGTAGEADILYDCVCNHILDIMDNENLSTIAIPAISSGVFGFPVAVSTSTIVEAIKDFLDGKHGTQPSGCISEIHLVDNKQHTVDAFSAALAKHFKNTPFSAAPPPSIAKKPKTIITDSPNSTLVSKDTLQTVAGMSIRITKGGIADQQVDMLMNTTLSSLRLNTGGVSKSIFQAAGSSIQDEVDRRHPQGLKEGQHAISSGGILGGSLGVQAIMHAVLPAWNQGNGVARKTLAQIVEDALLYASGNGFSSIALPAMGTGGLKFPPDVVAETLFSSAVEFSRKNPGTKVKDVRFVLFPGDQATITAFETELRQRTAASGATSLGSSFPTDGAAGVTYGQMEGTVGGVQRPFAMVGPMSSGTQSSGTDGAYGIQSSSLDNTGGEIQIGAIRLQVEQGDITDEKTDAIVNSTDARIDLTNGAVCKALAAAGGKTFVDQCKAKGSVGPRGVATTGAGALFVKNVIHLDARGRSNKSDWKDGIMACLQEAEANRITSLAFPALGTGNLNVPSDDMAVTMMETIAAFSKNNPNTCITLVRVVVFQPEMMAKYLEEMQKVTKSGSSFMGVITTPFKYVGKKVKMVKDMFTGGSTSTSKSKRVEDTVPQLTLKGEVSAMEFTVLGIKPANISAAKSEITKCCIRESGKIEICELEYADIIKKLTYTQLMSISKLGNSLGVELETKSSKIVIQGHKSDVFKAEAKVKEMLFKIKSEHMQEGSRQRELPSNWAPMGEETTKIVPLETWDSDYKEVMAEFRKTCPNEIIKIERLQNLYLYNTYTEHKEHMKTQVPKRMQFQRSLWHGTAADTVNNINTNGFDRSFCGKNATVFGQGVYFATDASYSRRYSRPDSNNHMQMYYARVLTGEYTKGDSSMRKPPYKSGTRLHYDSTVDKVDKPSIFVIYSDNAAYPEYIVTYKK